MFLVSAVFFAALITLSLAYAGSVAPCSILSSIDHYIEQNRLLFLYNALIAETNSAYPSTLDVRFFKNK